MEILMPGDSGSNRLAAAGGANAAAVATALAKSRLVS
jgi:hypothetical protein